MKMRPLFMIILLVSLIVACTDDDKPSGPRPTPTLGEILWQRPGEVITAENASKLQLIGYFGGHKQTVSVMGFSADNLRLATSSVADQLVQVWNLASGRGVRSITDLSAQHLFFSPDDNTLYTIGGDSKLYAWDMLDETQRPEGIKASSNIVGPVAQSADLNRLAVGSVDGRLFVFTLNPLAEVAHTDAHFFPVQEVLFSPDGNTVITLGQEGNIRLWKFDTLEQIHNIGQFQPEPQDIALSPDGKLLAASFPDSITIWQLDNDYLPLREFTIPENSGVSIAFSPDQSMLIASGEGELVNIWDVNTGELVVGLPGHQSRISAAEFSRDNRLVLTGTNGPNLFLWNLAAAETIQQGDAQQLRVPSAQIAPQQIPNLDIYRAVWSPDGKMIAISDARGGVYVLGIPSGE
ncbi:MAG: PD40 domain-containing protein [Chloroflexi bacterium]|nr:PD40 domain-containing protein [Chloroflexota bacterium]